MRTEDWLSVWLGFLILAAVPFGIWRPAVAFLGAQALNVIWTLLLAYLLFGGLIVPVPQLK